MILNNTRNVIKVKAILKNDIQNALTTSNLISDTTTHNVNDQRFPPSNWYCVNRYKKQKNKTYIIVVNQIHFFFFFTYITNKIPVFKR